MGLSTASTAMRDAETLHLSVLGPPVVRWGEHMVAFRTRKEFALLIYLALTRVPQPREQLAALLWADRDSRAARNVLRTTFSRLRQHLAGAGSTSVEAITLLRAEQDQLGREVLGIARNGTPSLTVDVELLEAATSRISEAAASPETQDKEALLQGAIDAYRGTFLEGVQFNDAPELDEWVGGQRAHWENQVQIVLGRLADLQLERRAYANAIATGKRWLALNPLSEPAYRALMRALAGAGDRAEALDLYERCRAVLQAELHVGPSPETVALAERLRRLPAPVATAARLANDGAKGRGVGVARKAPAWPDVELPFVGRESEFAALVSAYQAAEAGEVRAVILEGEAGIGKTRLAEEFLGWARLQEADVLRGRGYEVGSTGATLPYQPLVDALRPRLARENAPDDLLADVWLTELVRLFPELHERYPDLPSPAALVASGASGQGRLLEALLQFTLALSERAKPAALVSFYDDLQWSDLATRDVLIYLLKRGCEADSSHLLVLGVRSGALAGGSALESWLGVMSRQVRTTRLVLPPLDRSETNQAIAAALIPSDEAPGDVEAKLSGWLYDQTEGQPFYLVETLRELVDRGILVTRGYEGRAGQPSGWPQAPRLVLAPGVEGLPHLIAGTVHELIRSRLANLSQPALEMLTAATVLGPEATFERMRQVAALDEGAGLAALDDLIDRRFLVEEGGAVVPGIDRPAQVATFRSVQSLVREVVYTEAGDTRRRIFHRRALTLLERDGASPAERARHALALGLTNTALRSSVEAGEAALAVFAERDARAHFADAQRLLAGSAGLAIAELDHPQQWHDWGEAPDVPLLQGRERELATLRSWVREEDCRVIELLGAGGIGKTSLAAQLAHTLAPELPAVYWRSLRNAPPPEEWLVGAIAALSMGQAVPPEGFDARLRLLLGLLRAQPGLLVLDNLETVLEPAAMQIGYRAGYGGYGIVLQQLAESAHQGCLLLISREQPLPADGITVCSLRLDGLGVEEVRALLEHRALRANDAVWSAWVERYSGHPLGLRLVAETISTVFDGDIAAFLRQETAVVGGISQLLEEQLARLSPVEQAVMSWLAIEREPIGFAGLVGDLESAGVKVARREALEAVEALGRRSLLERGTGGFTLRPVVLEYVSDRLVEQLADEILHGHPLRLVSHMVIKAQAKEYVRRSQERLIGEPILQRLGAGGDASGVEQLLLRLLESWRDRPAVEQGYGPGNVVNLLRLLRGDLRELDLSRLAIRQAYLAEVEAQDASLAQAHLADSVLGEPFDYPTLIALSADGGSLVAGTPTGEVRLWRVADCMPVLALHGHTGPVFGLGVSADGALIASGSYDGTLKVWEAPSGRPLATLEGHTGGVYSLALSGDGTLLASSGADGTVRLWEALDGQPLAILQEHTGGVLALALSNDGGLLASGGYDGTVRLWEMPSGRPLDTLDGHTGYAIQDLAFSGNGRLLASGGDDGKVKLWEVVSGTVLAALQAHAGGVYGIALSRDGRLLASCGLDGAVRLWEAPSGRPLATLEGHTGGVYSLALSGDGSLLATGSIDGTVGLWETQSSSHLRTLRPERCYERMDITGLTGVTEAQRTALITLGAVERGD